MTKNFTMWWRVRGREGDGEGSDDQAFDDAVMDTQHIYEDDTSTLGLNVRALTERVATIEVILRGQGLMSS